MNTSLTADNTHEIFLQKPHPTWLKKYLYIIIISFFVSIGYFIKILSLSFYYLGNPIPRTPDDLEDTEYYSTILYGVSLLLLSVIAPLLSLGLFIQYQALRLRSVDRQYYCLKILVLFTVFQTGAALLNILCGAIAESIPIFSAIWIGTIPLIAGTIFTGFASKVLNVMLDAEEEPLKIDISSFQI